jgi:aminopeptidase N
MNFQQERIAGQATLSVTPAAKSIDTVRLSLLDYQIDSVKLENQGRISFQYNDTSLVLLPGRSLSSDDTARVTVFYQGGTPLDPTGWGGFYFRQGFAFNLGVGFGAKPHNFGRAWFPCLDNFTNRARYDFYITAPADKKAFCNGRLQGVEKPSGNRKTWHWQLNDPIPTYLASVAVGPYTTVRDQYQGTSDTFPITYAVKPGDSTQLKKGFREIHKALDVFTDFYGRQPFSRVGYALIPFRGGAMEHATNIAFPQSSLSRSLDDQRLWAHELSHHWWGDLATTHRAEEMWLNEGWATFSEFLFLDHVYGDSVYRQGVKQNHFEVLTSAHKRDGQYRPLVPVPHEATYGVHSYNKGGDVINTLRHHLGDSLFKKGVQRFLRQRSFEPMTSTGLRDTLEAVTGQSLEAFFDQWVFNPGYPHFSIQELEIQQAGNQYQVSGSIRQKLHEAPEYFENVRLPITAYFQNERDPVTRMVEVSGRNTNFSADIPAKPAYLTCDPNGEVADAKSVVSRTVEAPSTLELTRAKLDLTIAELPGSAAPVLAEHHWAAPEKLQEGKGEYELSNERYWRIEGSFQEGLKASATFRYDSSNRSDGLGPLDTEDLVLLYRPDRNSQWREYEAYNKSFLGNIGLFKLRDVKAGFYCFARQAQSSGQGELPASLDEQTGELKLFPQPAEERVRVQLRQSESAFQYLQVFTMRGKPMITREQAASGKSHNLSTTALARGHYILKATLRNNEEVSARLVIQ